MDTKAISRNTTNDYEARRRALGLRKSTVWIPDDDEELKRIKAYIKKRCKAKGIDI